MWECSTKSPAETQRLAAVVAQELKPGMVLCLAGDLGAGKTLFVKAAAKALGVDEAVTSPTFTLVNVYQGRLPVYHFDLYRLEMVEQLTDIGFDEYLHGEGVCLIEWPDAFLAAMPEQYLWIEIHAVGEEQRQWRFLPHGTQYEEISEEVKRSWQYLR